MRSLFLIVRRSLRQHLLSTVVTILSVGLATGLTMAVFGISAQARNAFTGGPVGFDAVLGARGSHLQLVLNSVFHLEASPGNIPWALYKEVAQRPGVALAIPYAVGDNYHGFRIVGTTTEIFSRFEYSKGKSFRVRTPGQTFDPQRREAVIGHAVALATGLREGSKFNPYHGVEFEESQRHAAEYVVVGILEPTHSPSDRVIWIPIEGVFRIEGHALRGAGENFEATPGEVIPEEHKEVSAVMLRFHNHRTGFRLSQEINRQGKVATLAYPIGAVMVKVFEKLGWVILVLEFVAYLTICVAAGTILASIYNAMNERRREFAILRALGARRTTVFSAIVLEAAAIATGGAIVGFAFYAGLVAVTSRIVQIKTGVTLDALAWHPALAYTPVAMVVTGALAGIVPAIRAYTTEVADHLQA